MKTPTARFLIKVVKLDCLLSPHVNTPCWIWCGSRRPFGHGEFWINGSKIPAHHFLKISESGPPGPGEQGCHHCDIPSCVNPDHIFWGTQKDNIQDAIAKNRIDIRDRARLLRDHPNKTFHIGTANSQAKLTEEQALRAINCPPGQACALAREFGVHYSLIYRIKNGDGWDHLRVGAQTT